LAGIYTDAGTLIPGTSDDDSGLDLDSFVDFTPETSGTYFVAARGYGDATGTYTLALRTIDDDFDNTTATTGVIAVGTPVTGNTDFFFDEDWFAAELAAATKEFRTSEAGTYFMAIEGFYEVGAYTLGLELVVDDLPADTTTTARVEQNSFGTGRLDSFGDVDWLAVTLEAGVAYRMTANWDQEDSPRFGTPVFTGLYDDEGVLVSSNPGFGGPIADLSVDSDGTYFIAVESSINSIGTYHVFLNELETVQGTQSNDWLTVTATRVAALDSVSGGAGVDMVSFVAMGDAVQVNLTTDTVTQDGLTVAMRSIENVTGSSYADVITGSDRSEILRGMGGNDLFFGSDNADVYHGGRGRDTLDYSAAEDGISVSLLRGRGSEGFAGGDRMRSIENVTATQGDDFIWGDHGNNVIRGLGGDDTIAANGGNDYILAGFGTDVIIFAGNRADYLIVEDGIRTEVTDLVGNDGADVIGHAEILRFADEDVLLM